MNQDIEKAIYALRCRAGKYAKCERYYRGDHDLAFATEKFANAFGSLFREFALNLCPAICDAVKDKLRIVGFAEEGEMGRAGEGETGKRSFSANRAAQPRDVVARIWDANRMGVRAGEVHKEALRNGDAYLIVWPGEDGRVVMYPNKASSCVVFYDEEMPGRVLWAAKHWRMADKRVRLNLFYPDRIERYVSRNESETAFLDATEFVAFRDAETRRHGEAGNNELNFRSEISNFKTREIKAEIENPYGIVPVFHFANNSDIGAAGVSELEAAIPIQDGLNKSVLDMLVAMEYSAYRQRWVTGIELESDESTGELIAPFRAGVEHLWTSENPESRFGDFNSADLAQFLQVKDGFRIDMASVTGTPLNYLQPQTKSVPSGESQRRAETRFIAKVRDRQAAFGQVWADAMALAVRMETGEEVLLNTEWEDPAAYSEREMLENALLRKQIEGLDAGTR